jgi:hypothetical protein
MERMLNVILFLDQIDDARKQDMGKEKHRPRFPLLQIAVYAPSGSDRPDEISGKLTQPITNNVCTIQLQSQKFLTFLPIREFFLFVSAYF